MNQRGISLLELLAVMALGTLMMFVGTLVSVPWLAREAMRGSLHDASVLLQTARIDRSISCSTAFSTLLSSRVSPVASGPPPERPRRPNIPRMPPRPLFKEVCISPHPIIEPKRSAPA